MKYIKAAFHPILGKIAAFLLLCVICTGVIGPKIISSGILYRDGFAIYGGAGKALLFGAITFVLLAKAKLHTLRLNPWGKNQLLWLGLGFASMIGAWFMVDKLIYGQNSLINILLTHILMIVSIIFAAGATIGYANIRMLILKFKRELILSASIAIAFYLFLSVVYGLWRYLSIIVLHSVAWLLKISGLDVIVIPDLTILLDKFGVTVEKYCSGIESIALFSGLYVIVGILDWHRLNKKRYFIIFPIALLILFMFNILRVYILILAGYYINVQLAFSLFHTYAGMIFFMLYSGVFWIVMYKHMLKKPNIETDKKSTN